MNKVLKDEQWKDIKGYEGLYLISDRGRVLSLYKYRPNGEKGYYVNTREMNKNLTKEQLIKN